MLTNLTYIPKILNQYKNITQKENIHNASYIGCPVGGVASNDQKLFNIK